MQPVQLQAVHPAPNQSNGRHSTATLPVAVGATRTLSRLQSFVTRYTSTPDETHLPRHIDGAAVDGSLVLGLPTYKRFTGGGLTVSTGGSGCCTPCPSSPCELSPGLSTPSPPTLDGGGGACPHPPGWLPISALREMAGALWSMADANVSNQVI